MEHHQRLPKKVLRPAPRAELSKLIEALDKDPGDYEPLSPSQWPPLQVLLPQVRKPARILFLTKDSVLVRWMTENILPRDSVVLCRYGLPPEEYLLEVRRRLSSTRDAIFVGDLDPLDLHVYLALSYGMVLPRGRPSLAIGFGGLNDACLRICERNLKRGRQLRSVAIKMRDSERLHFDILDRWVDIAAIVGQRSRELLCAGWKLELEGATNAAFFRDGHLGSILAALVGSGRLNVPALPRLA